MIAREIIHLSMVCGLRGGMGATSRDADEREGGLARDSEVATGRLQLNYRADVTLFRSLINTASLVTVPRATPNWLPSGDQANQKI